MPSLTLQGTDQMSEFGGGTDFAPRGDLGRIERLRVQSEILELALEGEGEGRVLKFRNNETGEVDWQLDYMGNIPRGSSISHNDGTSEVTVIEDLADIRAEKELIRDKLMQLEQHGYNIEEEQN